MKEDKIIENIIKKSQMKIAVSEFVKERKIMKIRIQKHLLKLISKLLFFYQPSCNIDDFNPFTLSFIVLCSSNNHFRVCIIDRQQWRNFPIIIANWK